MLGPHSSRLQPACYLLLFFFSPFFFILESLHLLFSEFLSLTSSIFSYLSNDAQLASNGAAHFPLPHCIFQTRWCHEVPVGSEGSDPCVHPLAMKQSPAGKLAMGREQLRGCSRSLLMQEVFRRKLSLSFFLTQSRAKNLVWDEITLPPANPGNFVARCLRGSVLYLPSCRCPHSHVDDAAALHLYAPGCTPRHSNPKRVMAPLIFRLRTASSKLGRL
jgi:hypothetical protein